eukprot:5464660-Pyramimonas_sp.AAC.1
METTRKTLVPACCIAVRDRGSEAASKYQKKLLEHRHGNIDSDVSLELAKICMDTAEMAFRRIIEKYEQPEKQAATAQVEVEQQSKHLDTAGVRY